MKYAAMNQQREQYSVPWMCKRLRVSKSGFYRWKHRAIQHGVSRDAEATTWIKATYVQSRGTYGSPRIHQALRQQGVRISKRRIERLMREHGLVGRSRRLFIRTTVSDSQHEPAPMF